MRIRRNLIPALLLVLFGVSAAGFYPAFAGRSLPLMTVCGVALCVSSTALFAWLSIHRTRARSFALRNLLSYRFQEDHERSHHRLWLSLRARILGPIGARKRWEEFERGFRSYVDESSKSSRRRPGSRPSE